MEYHRSTTKIIEMKLDDFLDGKTFEHRNTEKYSVSSQIFNNKGVPHIYFTVTYYHNAE